MKINVEKITIVEILTNSGRRVGAIELSKDPLSAEESMTEVIKQASGAKSRQITSLIERCEKLEARKKPVKRRKTAKKKVAAAPTVKVARRGRKPTEVTSRIREAFDAGHTAPIDVFAFLDKKKVKYRPESARSIVSAERKRRGLPSLKSRRVRRRRT